MSGTDELASSLHRGLLGLLLSIIALLGIGFARGLADGASLWSSRAAARDRRQLLDRCAVP